MTLPSTSGSHRLAIRRLATVSHVTVDVKTVETVSASTSLSLPARFTMGVEWSLTHLSPATGQVVAWNWAYRKWFQEGDGLSTYKLRNLELVDSLASVFAAVTPVHVDSPLGRFDEYVVSGTGTDASRQVVPRLLFYKNAAGTEQYLALYQLHYASPADGPDGISEVFVYEIVQIEVDELTLSQQLGRAQQAAIHDGRQRWG